MSPSSNREQSASATAALSNQCAPSPSHQFFFCGKISSHLQQQWFKATYLMAKDLLVLHRLLGFYFYQLQATD
ncbi:Os10g0318700 [Oryza sativa Japonica Group]|uniref:Os10g0318700 protein n=2 Tax=Oryza sativa subsp. japonica TaxID=39947 RepID=C7J7B7_ORYSJ|nr:Os10g0318700 [Oryza sativa Japonica Group]BAT10302.1 Os10g0318700 [Oryza sativa Japonica Group]|eukprot:NP_001176074.1 Os10g0318700 [Oryza sativa Japonica Group]